MTDTSSTYSIESETYFNPPSLFIAPDFVEGHLGSLEYNQRWMMAHVVKNADVKLTSNFKSNPHSNYRWMMFLLTTTAAASLIAYYLVKRSA
jgi:hypothetical protein